MRPFIPHPFNLVCAAFLSLCLFHTHTHTHTHTHMHLVINVSLFFSIFKPFKLMPKAKCSNLFYSLLKAVALDFGGYTLKSPGKRKKKKKQLVSKTY